MIDLIANISINGKSFKADLRKPLDLSLEVSNKINVQAWYVDLPVITPVKSDSFIGSVADGGAVNFRDIQFNPHGHGTHTECAGHITSEIHSVNASLKDFFSLATLISVTPEELGNNDRWMKSDDLIISKDMIQKALASEVQESLIIRTLPNHGSKKSYNYSSSNPAYIHPEAMEYISSLGIKHLLLDLPSVDREEDEGLLTAHRIFWNVPEDPDLTKTITEMIFVNDSIEDGDYLLELQVAPFNNDASPSRPVLYKLY